MLQNEKWFAGTMLLLVVLALLVLQLVECKHQPIGVLGRQQQEVTVQVLEDGSYILWGAVPWTDEPTNIGSGCLPEGVCQLAIADGSYQPNYPK